VRVKWWIKNSLPSRRKEYRSRGRDFMEYKHGWKKRKRWEGKGG
jgi:hypothetical protein